MQTPVQKFRSDIMGLLKEALDEEAEVWRTCIHCLHFDEQKEVCERCDPPCRPPARVIAFGCPLFDDGETIPFAEQKKTILPLPPKVRKWIP